MYTSEYCKSDNNKCKNKLNNAYEYHYYVGFSYCSEPPKIPNAVYGATPSPYVGDVTSFNCTTGYMSSGGSINPFFKCLPVNTSAGIYAHSTV